MKLYITPLSPYARLARIVVLEKGLESRVEVIAARMCGGLNMAQLVLACGLQYGSYVLGLDWHGAYPNLARWLDQIAQRPALAATAPPSGR